jgi:acyl-CoA synthetase (NDP forming)
MSSRLRPLIDPRSIAIFGASADLARLGGVPVALLLQHGFAGPVYPINPKYDNVGGLKCYPNIESLPEPVDLLVIAVAAPEVVPVLKQAAAKGIRSAVVFAAGFAEAGDEEGRHLQDELVRCARELNIQVAGPNCMGFGNLDTHAYSTFTSIFRTTEPPAGIRDVALVTQSGSLCAAVYAAGRNIGVKFNLVISTGNEACVEFSEYLEYLASRPGTEAIVGYVEGLRDGNRFQRVAALMRDQGRLLSILKVGETAKGAEAAASHTAAIAGSQDVYRAIFDRLCVVPAHDMLHLADIAYISRFRNKTNGARVAILTISGAIGALLSDRFIKAGVNVPTLSDAIQTRLHEGIPRYGMVQNPVDLTGNIVNRHAFVADALRVILDSGEVDFAVVYAPGFLLDRIANDIAQLAQTTTKLVAAISTGTATARAHLEKHDVPVFEDTTRAVNALASLALWHENRRKSIDFPIQKTEVLLPLEVKALVQKVRTEKRLQLNENEAKQVLYAFEAPVIAEKIINTADQAIDAANQLGYPVALKVLSPDITHKTEVGGVLLNLNNQNDIRLAFDEITASVRSCAPQARIDGMVVQQQAEKGVELLLGVVRDPTFGLIMTVGLGGVWVELLKDVVHAPLPVTAQCAETLLQSLKAWPLLNGFRSSGQVNVSAVAQTMERLSNAALALGDELEQMEINPLIAQRDGAVVIDAFILLSNNALPCSAHGQLQEACYGA